jgi:hypothetical protein
MALPPHTPPKRQRLLFGLMLVAVGCQSIALTAILIHMVPLTTALGMGAAGLWASTLFGPSQVASRLINMIFGQRLRQAWLAVISACLYACRHPCPDFDLALVARRTGFHGSVRFWLGHLQHYRRHTATRTVWPLRLWSNGWLGDGIEAVFAGAFSPFALAAMQASLSAFIPPCWLSQPWWWPSQLLSMPSMAHRQSIGADVDRLFRRMPAGRCAARRRSGRRRHSRGHSR